MYFFNDVIEKYINNLSYQINSKLFNNATSLIFLIL